MRDFTTWNHYRLSNYKQNVTKKIQMETKYISIEPTTETPKSSFDQERRQKRDDLKEDKITNRGNTWR